MLVVRNWVRESIVTGILDPLFFSTEGRKFIGSNRGEESMLEKEMTKENEWLAGIR